VLERDPTKRLATLSLIGSASAFEDERKVPPYCVANLATLIDLFCLYDKIVFLGVVPELLLQSATVQLLTETEFLEPALPRRIKGREMDWSRMQYAVSWRLSNFLQIDRERSEELAIAATELSSNERQFEEFFKASMWRSEQPLRSIPEMRKRLSAIGAHDEENLALLRVFFYLVYAEETGTMFSPDFERVPIVQAIVRKDEEFRGKLLSSAPLLSADPTSGFQSIDWRKASPFAAIVFERSGRDRRRIAPEMLALRQQLDPLRRELRSQEQQILEAKTKKDELRAIRKWNQIIDDVKRKFGGETMFESIIKRTLNYASALDDTRDSKLGGLAQLTALSAETLRSIMTSRHLIELRRVSRNAPSSARLQDATARLFDL